MGEHEGGQEGDERRESRDIVRLVLATFHLLALAFLSLSGAKFMELFRETGRLDAGPLPLLTRILVAGHPAVYVTVYGLAAAALVAKDFLLKDRSVVGRINIAALWAGAGLVFIYMYALFRPIMGPSYGL